MTLHRSLFFTFIQRYVTLALTLGVAMISARILAPEDFGTFAVAHAFFTAIDVFVAAGVTQYIVQERRLTVTKLRAAFTVSIAMSVVFALVLLAARHEIARLFEAEAVADLLLVFVFVLLIAPVNALQTGMLMRRMRFRRLMVAGVCGSVALATTTVTLLLLGHGAASLAWGAAAEAVAITAVLARSIRRVLPPGLSGSWAVFRFTMPISASALVKRGGRIVPQLVVARTLGVAATGLLNRSMAVTSIFGRAVSEGVKPVIIPAFAREKRRARGMLDALAAAAVRLCAIAWPFFAFMAIFADPIVAFLFGPDWAAIVPIVQVLAVGGFAAPLVGLMTDLLAALGRVGALFWTALVSTLFKIVAVVALATTQESVALVVSGMVAANVLEAAILLRVVLRVTAGRLADLLRAIVPTAVVTALTVLPPAAVVVLLPESGPIVTLAVAGLVAAGCWLAAVHLVAHPLREDLRVVFGVLARRVRERGRFRARGGMSAGRASALPGVTVDEAGGGGVSR